HVASPNSCSDLSPVHHGMGAMPTVIPVKARSALPVLRHARTQLATVELAVIIAIENRELLAFLRLDLAERNCSVAVDVEPAFHPVGHALDHLLECVGLDFLTIQLAVCIGVGGLQPIHP